MDSHYTADKDTSDLSFEVFDADALRLLGAPVEDNSIWHALGLSPHEYDLEGVQ